jgi:ABC-type oligopeptide transport system substrate-binding subunit
MLYKITWVTFVLLLAVACKQACPGMYMKPHPQGVLRLAYEDRIDHLDLRAAASPADYMMAYLLYEGLLGIDSYGKLTLALAEKVTVSADGSTYTFKLRPAFWSNGDRITATDFVYSWRRALDPLKPGALAHQLWPIKNAEAIQAGRAFNDELGVFAFQGDTLVVELENSKIDFLPLLTTPAYFAVNSRWAQGAEDSADTKVPTSGPFIITEWQPGTDLMVTKNPSYWNAATIQLTEVHMIAAGSDAALNLFTEDDVDWVGTPLVTFSKAKKDALLSQGCLQSVQVQVIPAVAVKGLLPSSSQGTTAFHTATIDYLAKPRVRTMQFTYSGCPDVRHVSIARYNIDL